MVPVVGARWRSEVAFALWSGAEHMKRWVGRENFTCPHVTIDFRVGGTHRNDPIGKARPVPVHITLLRSQGDRQLSTCARRTRVGAVTHRYALAAVGGVP